MCKSNGVTLSVADTYVTGSVFKTFISAAALEEKIVSLDTTFTCVGSNKRYRVGTSL